MLIKSQKKAEPKQPSKLERYYYTYRYIVYNYVFPIVKNEEDAEDIVHETYTKIAKHIKHIPEPEGREGRAYILTAAKNTAINLLNRNRLRNHDSWEEVRLSTEYDSRRMELAECLRKLPEEDRELLFLRFEYGYTREEVAQMLHQTEGILRKREQRAKEQLLKICKEADLL